MTTAKQERIYLDELKVKIEKEQKEIKTYILRLQKAAKINDFREIKHVNGLMASSFRMIDSLNDYIKSTKERIKEYERREAGYGVIVDFLAEVLVKDIDWHRELVEDYNKRGYKEYSEMLRKKQITKVIMNFARMSEEEAIDMFKYDMDCRYIALVGKIETKVGEVTNIKLKRNENCSFDGIVEGTKGTMAINTIPAGGFNIQRFHYRTLTKLLK